MAVAEFVVDIAGNIAPLAKSLGQAESRLKSVGQKLSGIGKNLSLSLSAPIVGFGASIVSAAGNFEAAMNRVGAKSQATRGELKSLTQLAEELGATTQFSASQAANGLEFLAQAGFNATQQMQALPGVLSLAASTNIDLGRASDIATNVLSQFRLNASETSRVVDILAKATISSNTNMEQLANAMNYLGPTAAALGVKLEDAAAVVEVMSNNGLQGSLGTQALGSALVRLNKPTEGMRKVMSDLNLAFFDAQGQFIGIQKTVKLLEDRFVGLTQQQKNMAISTLFGMEAFQEFSILVNTGSEKLGALTADLQNAGGTADRVAGSNMKGLNGALKNLSSAFEGLQIAIAKSGLLDFATKLVNKITGLLRNLTTLNPVMLKVGTIIAGVAAAIGPLVLAIGGFVALLPTLQTGFAIISSLGALGGGITSLGAAFAALTGPIGLTVAAVVAGVSAIIANWDEIVDYFTTGDGVGAFKMLKEGISTAIQGIKNVISVVVDEITEIWNSNFVQQIIGSVQRGFKLVVDIVALAFNSLGQIFGLFGNLVSGNFDGALTNLQNIFRNVFLGIFKVVSFTIGSIINTLQNFVKDIPVVGEKLASGLEKAKQVIDAQTFGFENLLPPVEKIETENSKVVDSFKKTVEAVQTTVSGLGNPLKSLGSQKVSAPEIATKGLATLSTTPISLPPLQLEKLEVPEVSLEAITEKLTGVGAAFDIINNKSEVFGSSFDAVSEKTAFLKDSITQLLNEGMLPSNPVIETLKGKLEELQTTSGASNEAFQQFGTSMAQSVGQAVQAIASGSSSIKDSIRGIIKAFISQGVAAIIGNTLKGPTGLLGPAGVAVAGAAGAAASALFSKMIPAFADGGIVSGPTLALVGEYSGARGNPEVIAPLDKLKGMIDSGAPSKMQVEIVGQLEGDTIRLLNKNTDEYIGATS